MLYRQSTEEHLYLLFEIAQLLVGDDACPESSMSLLRREDAIS